MENERRELVEINLAAAWTAEELHTLLAESLGFPKFYGRNWDAFWDAITGLVAMPRRLRLVGWEVLASRLPADARLMRECLDEAVAEDPHSSARVEFD